MQYYIINDNTQKGPFPKEKLLENGLLPKSLVWREGLLDWVEASSLYELNDIFESKKDTNSSKAGVKRFIVPIIAVAIALICVFLSFYDNNDKTYQSNQDTYTPQTQNIKLHASVSSAEQIRSNSAVLKGVLNSNSNEVLSYSFEYTQNGYTKTVLASVEGDMLSATVTDLYANTRCEYCIVEKQNEGTIRTTTTSFTTLQKPTEINAKATSHSGRFFANLSVYYLKKKNIIAACDYRNNVVRSKAAQIASQSAGNFNIGQVCDIFDYCYNNWKYVNDPNDRGSDYYQKASNTIKNGLTGDCDDFAILMASMLLSVGGDVRVNGAYTESSGHAFTEINLGKTDIKIFADYIRARYDFTSSVWYRKDSEGNGWLNLDWWAKHPGGEYYEGKRGVRFYIIDEYLEEFSYK